jgi:hypothetical protein
MAHLITRAIESTISTPSHSEAVFTNSVTQNLVGDDSGFYDWHYQILIQAGIENPLR